VAFVFPSDGEGEENGLTAPTQFVCGGGWGECFSCVVRAHMHRDSTLYCAICASASILSMTNFWTQFGHITVPVASAAATFVFWFSFVAITVRESIREPITLISMETLTGRWASRRRSSRTPTITHATRYTHTCTHVQRGNSNPYLHPRIPLTPTPIPKYIVIVNSEIHLRYTRLQNQFGPTSARAPRRQSVTPTPTHDAVGNDPESHTVLIGQHVLLVYGTVHRYSMHTCRR
jgi:hypothetical protein